MKVSSGREEADYRTGNCIVISNRHTGDDPDRGWVGERFDGKHDEATYDNNKMSYGLTGSEAPPRLFCLESC